jgi:hypothetical protein
MKDIGVSRYDCAVLVAHDGRVVVGSFSPAEPFYWRPELGGQINLKHLLEEHGADFTGWGEFRTRGISADGGTIVGEAKHFGVTEAWIATVPAHCYPDCDGSGTLDIDDVICFSTMFAVSDLRANCDGSNELDADDFTCFHKAFALGCP